MKILICEDDKLNLKINKAMVEDYLENRGIRKVKLVLKSKVNLITAKKELSDVDIAILDIDLQDQVDGLNIAQFVKEQNPYVALIFITSFDSYALDAWKLHSCGFLQKPVKIEDFKDVFTRALLQFNGLCITKMNRMIHLNSKISVKERNIYCIEKVSGTKDIKVTTNKETYVFRGTIKEVKEKLCSSFVQISRSVMINIHYIFKIENGVIELSNEKVFLIAPNKEKEVRELCSQMNI